MASVKSSRKRLIKIIVYALAVLCLSLTGYCLYLSICIDKRFSGRRWSIASRVFSDITTLYPGQHVRADLLLRKLNALGYREVADSPEKKGEFRYRGDVFELFLKDLRLPMLKRDGFPVKIGISSDTISEITRSKGHKPVPIVELGPEQLGHFFGRERESRRLISIREVPDPVQRAFLAAEDIRFYKHHGIDLRGILRAFYTNIRRMGIYEGGSTITQQLAKNYFLSHERTLSRKLKEMFLALVMEIMYGKDEILELYLNEIYFGQNGSIAVNGLGEASYFYFGKPVNELSCDEGAVLAGLVRAPNTYSPYIDQERSKRRRDKVLGNMLEQDWISEADYRTALSSPLILKDFKEYGRQAPYFMDYLATQIQDIYSKDGLSKLGLSIFTTLDTQVQRAAEIALTRGLERIEEKNPSLKRKEPLKKLQGAVVVMQPRTGYILAMIGGRDYSVSQFNRITQAKRQPGSAFKPFVFLSALDKFTPSSMVSNIPVTYNLGGRDWRPMNFSRIPDDRVSLRTALAHSVNVATVDLAMKIGLEAVVETALAFRFSTPLKAYPSIALGACEVIPIELARSYCAFAADGLLPVPLSLKEIYDENDIILERDYMKVERVTTPPKSYIMNSLLRSVVEEGTAKSLGRLGIKQPVAGKTGTTNDSRDAWFVGYTPDILAMIWVGFDDGSPTMGTGASLALPIWVELIKEIPQYLSGSWFKKPHGVIDRVICPESGQLALSGHCPEPEREVFLEQMAPTIYCSIHRIPASFRTFFKKVKDLADKF